MLLCQFKAKLAKEMGKEALLFLRKHVGDKREIGIKEFADKACIKEDTILKYLHSYECLTEVSAQRVAFGLVLFLDRILEVYLKRQKENWLDDFNRKYLLVNDHTYMAQCLKDDEPEMRNRAENELRLDFVMAFGTSGVMALKLLGDGKREDLEKVEEVCRDLYRQNNHTQNFSRKNSNRTLSDEKSDNNSDEK